MNRFLMRWAVLTVGVLLASFIVRGISYDSWLTLFAASLVLGILNTMARPVLMILTFPFILLTFGLFIVVINAGLLLFTSWLLQHHGFHVAGFGPAFWGAIIISLVNMVMSKPEPRRNRNI